jgi:TonB family protein
MGFGHLASRFLATYEAVGGDPDRVEEMAAALRSRLIVVRDSEACIDALRAAGHRIPPLGGDSDAEPPVFADGGEYQGAKAVERQAPQYPEDLRLNRLWGKVQLRVVVLENGEARCLTVLEATHLDFAKASVEAVRNWRFEPAIVRGRPAVSHFVVTINFELR